MKHWITLTIIVLSSTALYAQSLDEAWSTEIQYRKTGMAILGSWAVANLAGGMALRANTEGSTRYFHEMNAIWNTVNLGIAAVGYYGATRLDPSGSAAELFNEQATIDKTLLFNAGLDIAYMAGGFYMIERSKNNPENADRWRGYGRSVILQGAFLFAFDVMMVVVHPTLNLPEGLQLGLRVGAPDFLAMRWVF